MSVFDPKQTDFRMAMEDVVRLLNADIGFTLLSSSSGFQRDEFGDSQYHRICSK
jgi:hypothetical protein